MLHPSAGPSCRSGTQYCKGFCSAPWPRCFWPTYNGDAFVAFHASGPYYKRDGYKVVRVGFANGVPVRGYEALVTDFMLAETYPPHVWGTPAGLAIAKDGSRLIADEQTVWRVKYNGR